MITSPSKLPKAITEATGAILFRSPDEKYLWTQDYIKIARQRLEDTGRWDKKHTILRNVNKLTPMEKEKLADAMSLKIMQYRADRALKKGVAGVLASKSALLSKHHLLDTLFEGKVRAESKTTIQDLLNEPD